MMSKKTTILRRLGKGGPEVPALGYGLISLAGFYGSPPDKEERFAVLDHAAKIGETFWDSSEFVFTLAEGEEKAEADISQHIW